MLKQKKYFFIYLLTLNVLLFASVSTDLILLASIVILAVVSVKIDSSDAKKIFKNVYFVLLGLCLLSNLIIGEELPQPERAIVAIFAVNAPIFYVLLSLDFFPTKNKGVTENEGN